MDEIKLREAKNEVRIEGILSEINIKLGSFEKNGKTVENISGVINVRVTSKEGELEVPVHLYANKMTNKGTINPAYTSIEKVMKEFVSIAASNEQEADRVRITGKIKMNEYPGNDGKIKSYPRITASFVNKIKKEEMKSKANFLIEFKIGAMGFECDQDGVETDKYVIKGIVPMWGNVVDVVPFNVANENVRSSIMDYWQVGDSVQAEGRLNFSYTTKTEIIQPGFGEAREETKTISVSELLITGGCPTPLDGDYAWDDSTIASALAQRKARHDAMLENGKTRANQRKAPAEAASSSTKGYDLGF